MLSYLSLNNKKISYYLSFLAFFMILWSSLFGLKPFLIGSQSQSESQAIFLYISTAISLISLLILNFNNKKYRLYFRHPLFCSFFTLGILTLLTSLLQDFPRLSFSGSPSIGDGALQFIGISLVAPLYLIFRKDTYFRVFIVLNAIIALSLIVILTLYNGAGSLWAPYWRSDFLSFFMVAFFLIVIASYPKLLRYWIFLIIILIFILFFLGNNASFGALLLSSIGYIILRCMRLRQEGLRKFFLAAAFFMIIGSMTAVIFVGTYYGGALYAQKESSLQDIPFFNGFAQSQWDRTQLLKVGLAAVEKDPLRLFYGFGWGRFPDLLAQHLRMEGIATYNKSYKGSDVAANVETTNWVGANWSGIHSHNIFAEAFFSQGILGVLLLVSWFYFALKRVRSQFLVPASILILTMIGSVSVWFLFPPILPFIALSIAMVTGGRAKVARFSSGSSKGTVWALGLVLVFVLGNILLSLDVGLRTNALREVLLSKTEAFPEEYKESCQDLLHDYGFGDAHLYGLYAVFAEDIQRSFRDKDPLPADMSQKLEALTCAAGRWMEGKSLTRLALVDMSVRQDLWFLTDDPDFRQQVAPIEKDWALRVAHFLKRYPQRIDAVAPYLNRALALGHEEEIRHLTELVLEINPHEPVALWFSGITLLGLPNQTAAQQAEALQRLREAIDRHVDAYMPLPAGVKDAILAKTQKQ